MQDTAESSPRKIPDLCMKTLRAGSYLPFRNPSSWRKKVPTRHQLPVCPVNLDLCGSALRFTLRGAFMGGMRSRRGDFSGLGQPLCCTGPTDDRPACPTQRSHQARSGGIPPDRVGWDLLGDLKSCFSKFHVRPWVVANETGSFTSWERCCSHRGRRNCFVQTCRRLCPSQDVSPCAGGSGRCAISFSQLSKERPGTAKAKVSV